MNTLGTAHAWAQHAVQIHSTLLSHTKKEMLSRVERKFDQFKILNTSQQGVHIELHILRACTVDKSSAFARCFKYTFTCKGD